MKIKKIIGILILILFAMLLCNLSVVHAEVYPYPSLQKQGERYIINLNEYNKYKNIWCINSRKHLTSHHSCLYVEKGQEVVLDMKNETDEKKIKLAKGVYKYYKDTPSNKVGTIAEGNMQVLSKDAGFGIYADQANNLDEIEDYANIVKKLNELKSASPKELTAKEESDGVYSAEFKEFSGLSSDEFKFKAEITEGSGTVTVEPDGLINSSGNSAKIKISNVSEDTTQVKVKFSCKIEAPTILKYKVIELEQCDEDNLMFGKHTNVAPEIANWSQSFFEGMMNKLVNLGKVTCEENETTGTKTYTCKCGKGHKISTSYTPNKAHSCIFHHFLNIFERSTANTSTDGMNVNNQELALYYLETGELEFEFEVIIKLTKEPPTKIIVKKQWSASGVPTGSLPAVTITVTGNNYNESYTFNGNGQHEFENIKKGEKYTITETTHNGSISYNGKEYTWEYVSGETSSAEGGKTYTINNKVKPPDEPPPTEEPGEPGEPKLKIEKKVVHVFSEYEQDTSDEDVIENGENAKVQRGDEVVFEIKITNISEIGEWKSDDGLLSRQVYNPMTDGHKRSSGQQTVKMTPDQQPSCPGFDHHNRKFYVTPSCISNGHVTKVWYSDQKAYSREHYFLKEINLTDTLEKEKVEDLKLYTGSESTHNVTAKNQLGYTDWQESGTWTGSGNNYTWKTTYDYGLAKNESTTFYIIGKVLEDWEDYGDSDTNTAKVESSKFSKIKEVSITYNECETKYTHTFNIGSEPTYGDIPNPNYDPTPGWPNGLGGYIPNPNYDPNLTIWGQNGTQTYYEWANCSDSTTKTPHNDKDSNVRGYLEDGEVNGNTPEDTAKVTLQGYGAEVEKELEFVDAQIEKANPTGDSGNETKVEWGDLLEYRITVTNTGDDGQWETNFYEGLYVNDYFNEEELKYVGDPDGENYYNDAYDRDLTKKQWQDSPISEWETNSSGEGKNYYKDDDSFDLGTSAGEGLAVGDCRDENISTVVVSKPGGSVTNNADLIAIKNRNGVEIEMGDHAEVTNEVRKYKANIDKYVEEVTSEGLMCSDKKTNEVAEQFQLDNREWQEDGQKEGNPAMSDRGDKIKYTITFKNESEEANIWKFKLTDKFDPQLEYIDEWDADKVDDGEWTVEKKGDHEITIIYVGKDLEPGQELRNNQEWAEVGPGDEVSINLYFQVVDGAEYAKKDEKYKNTVKIEQVWNRNSKHLVEGNIEFVKQESSDWVKVRQISASIDKYVSSLFGGIEGDVSNTINNATRNRKDETKSSYDSQENLKKSNPVEVERGDEITYTVVVKNTQNKPLDNLGGLISAMDMVDKYDEHLIFSRIASGPVELTNNDTANRQLDIKYTGGHLLPGDEFRFTLAFIMTQEPSDISNLYEKIYENKIQIKELKNVNDWTWSLEGAINTHHNDTCQYAGPCVLSSLQNEGGITADLPSSDYVYMLPYAVELEKYVVNVEHTNDDGSVENYNKDNEWASQDGQNDREVMNYINGYEKTKYKETYPVQVEKGDIVTYEIKIKNTYNVHNGGLIKPTTLQPSIYKIDISDVFNSEDNTKIGDTDIGLKFLEAKAEKGGEVKVNYINDSAYMFEFTPQGQCNNAGKNTSGYGIGTGEEATFTITVEVTRSNMYLYELINRATIQDVYNRNNNVGTYQYSSPEGRNGVEYKVTNGNRLYRDVNGNIVNQIIVKDPWGNDYPTSLYITDADYINLKDLIISGYVWDDTDIDNNEDGLMTWGLNGSSDVAVEGPVYAYLYRLEPTGIRNYPNQSTLVMKTQIDENGYYIFGTKDTEVYGDRVTVNQMHRYEPTNYKKPRIKVNGNITKDTENKEIYLGGFTNYRIVKAPNKDYSQGSTTRYWTNEYKGYYQYYVEFEYNGMKYTHTVYATDSVLNGDKGNKGNESNQDGQYNLNTNGRATRLSENWLPWRTSPKDNSEYYEIDSNSAEFKSVREAFNNKFETVEYNRGISSNGTETSLSYTHTGHVSTLNYSPELYIRARSFVTNWIEPRGNIDSLNPSDTNTLFFWDSDNLTRNYRNTVGTTEETEYLKYINLGLKQRPSLDLELTKDVYDVQVDINEKTTVYDYSSETIDRGNLSLMNRSGVDNNGTAQLENLGGEYTPGEVANDNNQNHIYYYNSLAGYQKTGYQLDLYKSDWLYRYTDYQNKAVEDYKYGITVANSEHNNDNEASHSELNVQITYKYTITNKSNNPDKNKGEVIIGALNELVDYHQSDLIPNTVGTYVINRGGNYTPVGNEKRNESGYVLVGETPKYSNINGNNNVATGVGDLGDFKTCYIYSVDKAIDANPYTEKIKANGYNPDFELKDERLYPGDSIDIYLTFTVSRNTLENRTLNLDNVTKYNVAEINSFSSYYSENQELRTEWSKDLDTPGLVDKDSNPGNTEITRLDDVDNYEDDTFKVDIKFTLDHNEANGNNRIIDGLVWEDVNYGDKGTAIGHTITQTGQVTGDGIYYEYRNNPNQDHDCLVGGVKVELIELITVNDVVYEERVETETRLATTSSSSPDSKGRYKLSGFIPGNYIVRFTYGNKDSQYVRFSYDEAKEGSDYDFKYNGQDYKSTTYQTGIENNKNEEGYVTNVWHDMISDDVNNLNDGKHLSDVRDDEVRRLEVIAYSRTINNKVAEILNTRDLTDPTFTDNTYMYADTAKLQIEGEHLKYVESDGFTENKEQNTDARYNKVNIYHGKTEDASKFIVGNYYRVDAFGNRIPSKVDKDNELNMFDRDNNTSNGGLSKPLARYTYRVADVDFGMEARPTTNMSLHKMISGIKVTTADGETIVEVEYEPTYDKDAAVPTKIITGAEHIQHVANQYSYIDSVVNDLGNSNITEATIFTNEDGTMPDIIKFIYKQMRNKQGFYYINIDEDLMQGAVVTINYSISVTNDSEVDTLGVLTGFNTGEEIYDETFAILTENPNESSYKPNNTNNDFSFARYYDYIGTRKYSNDKLPTYNDGKLNITDSNDKGFNYGYYLGATYYNGEYHGKTHVVETRIDQIIDYVDNDLTVREQDNNTKDATWRNVSLAELVAGEIQKDVVGQEKTNNEYNETRSVKYVPYGRTDSTNKNITVSNVGNMLSDSVYRVRNVKATTRNVGNDEVVSDREHAILHANVQGEVTLGDGDTGIIDNRTGNEVTIIDEEAREYVTSAKNNIVLSIPEKDSNPDLYTYLIPEKALNGTPLTPGFFTATENDIDRELGNYTDSSDETKEATKLLWNLFNEYREGRSGSNKDTYKWFINFTNIIISDDSISEIYNNEYKVLGRELLIQIVKDNYLDVSDEAKGTLNGVNFIANEMRYERNNTQSSARINLQTTRTLSADRESKDVSFENIAEIIQFSNESGRRDEYATVGDAAIWKGAWKASTPSEETPCPDNETPPIPDGTENYDPIKNNPTDQTQETYDTDTTEVILLSPPTGVSQSQLVKIEQQETMLSVGLIVGGVAIITSLGGIVLIKIRRKNKFYR